MSRLLEILHQGICVIDKNDTIKYINNTFVRQIQYRREDIIGKKIKEVFCFTGDERHLIIRDKLENVSHLRIEYIEDYFDAELMQYMIIEDCQYKREKEVLEAYFNRLPFFASIKDREGQYIFVNDKCVEMAKQQSGIHSRDHIVGKIDVDLWNTQYALELRAKEQLVIQNKQGIIYDEEVFSGRERVRFHVNRNFIPDAEGNVQYLTGIKIDRSYEYTMEKKLERSYEQMSTLKSILDDGEHALVILERIKEEMRQRLNAEYMSVLTYDEEEGRIGERIQCGHKVWVDYKEFEGIKITWKDIKNQQFWGIKPLEEIEYNNRQRERRERSDLRETGICYEATYPLVYQHEILGIFSFGYKDAMHIPKELEGFINVLVKQISILLKNAHLGNKIKKVLRENNLTKEEMNCILNTAVDVIGIISLDGEVKKVNKGYRDVLEWEEGEVLGQYYDKLIHPNDKILFEEWASRCRLENSIEPFTCRIKCGNGQYKWLQWRAQVLEKNNLIIAMGRDVTKERELEEEKLEYEKALQLETLKNEFFANLSHEFKTPINIVLSMMQLMERNIEDGSIYHLESVNLDKHIKIVKQNAYRLLRLVNNLIDITRIDAGYYKVNLENHNIIYIVEEITMSVAEYIQENGIELVFDTEEEEVILACDPDKIERIMLNLLSNAVKAMKGDNYPDRALKIQVNIRVANQHIYVYVRDNGIGIPQEKLGDIFGRFVQVENSLTRKTEGSGIGLALVKSLVKMHGGEIYVESEEGIETSFYFSIPIKQIAQADVVMKTHTSNKIEKCVIEFSDIYGIQ